MSHKKARVGFFFTDLSQHFGMYLVAFALNLFFFGEEVSENNFKSSIYLPDMEILLAITPKIMTKGYLV